ncbi:hypothetical protein [Lewinella sp. JB7]|uniref:hypothetical protein n=1 Tax=Lewinella sp. JB7 TaxID=2962887 RepID=UPI0020C9E5A6|nr:hypothetical protein [Lewinella sp. JB7]MCP9234464.1 hypothetical protein [Lewinella sp. JB7]
MQSDNPTGKRVILEVDNPVVDPRDVCAECLNRTKIRYPDGGNFFTPRLRSINHLEVGRSKIISSPVTIIVEYVVLLYQRTVEGVRRLLRQLFPRHPRIRGRNFSGASFVGRTTYAGRYDHGKPIHHLPVDIWARTWWGSWRHLASGVSGKDGTFRLPYDLREARSWAVRRIRAEVSQISFVYDQRDQPRPVHSVAESIHVPKKELTGMEYNLRDIQIGLWAYRRDTPIPRTYINDHDHDAPERYVQGRTDALQDQIIPIELTKLKHLAQLATAPESLSIPQIQADYPLNLTTCIENTLPPELKGYTRGDEFFGARMMNGMNAASFRPDPDHPHHYWMLYWGYQGYDHNDVFAFPTTEIKYSIRPGNHTPLPVEIIFTGALDAYHRDPWQQRRFRPGDGARWTYAKRVARSVGGLVAEVDDHFAHTHTNTEQYALAAFRNLRLNPVNWLMQPHLREVSLVDHTADRILVSQRHGYIPRASALTGLGIQQRVEDTMGVLDWKGREPMRVINDAHTYAKAENLFWNITREYVEEFFERNLEAIAEHWYEIYRMSEDMVNHSVRVFRSRIDLDRLDARERKMMEKRITYFESRYSFDPTLPRRTVNGELKILSPITESETFLDAQPGVLQNLKDWCVYVIHTATFMHTWVNEHQYEDIGEVLYSCLGLRFGEGPDGVLAPESDYRIAPDPVRATQMMWWSNLLSRTEYGFITRNEDRDVNPRFGEMLKAHEEEFRSYGVIVDDIEARTNI